MAEETTEKQHKNNFDWLKEYQWQKGQSGNPNGRPKGKTLKEFGREFLAGMSEEARIEFLKGLDPELVWKMAEGNPAQDTKVDASVEVVTVVKYANGDNPTPPVSAP